MMRRRVLVVGSGGAGKSMFARRLAAVAGLPLIHLDREYWSAGGVPTPSDVWADRVASMVAGDEWIIDGNYGSTLELRVRKADWVVFFDFPRWRCFVGVLRRRFNRRAERPDMAPGCPERLNREFVRFVWRFPSVGRRRVVDALVDLPPGADVVVVRSRRDVERVLASWPVTAYQLALAADRDRAVASLGDLKLGCGTMLGG